MPPGARSKRGLSAGSSTFAGTMKRGFMPSEMTYTALMMVAAAILITFVRLVRGPTLPDRVVALDLIGVSSVGLMVLGAAASGEREFLDAAIVIALLGFLGTVAYARYAEKENQ